MSNDIVSRKKYVFANLVKNEIIKFYSTKITFIIVTLILVGVLLFTLSIDSQKELFDGDPREVLENEINELNEYLSGGYGLSNGTREYYLNCIEVDKYMLKNDISPIKIHSIGNLVLSLNQMFSITVIIMILGAGKIWTDEFGGHALLALISRPISRMKIFFSKFVTLVSLCVFIQALTGIFSILIGGIFFGFDGINDVFVSYNNGIVVKSVIGQILYYDFYNFFTLLACAIVTILVALIVKNGIIATCISIIIYLMGSTFVLALSKFEFLKYSLLANIQFQIYLDGNEIFEGITPTSSIINILIHVVIFVVISMVIFCKRNADEWVKG